MARLAAWIDRALAARSVAWALGAVSAVVGLALALDPGWMHDEGLLTYGFSRSIAQAPLAFAFFQKAKPVLAAAYALPASLGLEPFLVTHALVIALATPIAAEGARALGARRPNVAALAIAASPFMLRSGGTALSNADGVLAGLIALLLAARGRPFAAGLVAGASVWVRYETGVLAVVLFVAALAVPRLRRMAAGIVVFPATYLLAGALYHADPLWFAHFPPSMTQPMQGYAVHLDPIARHSSVTLFRALLSVSPAMIALVLLPVSVLTPLERALAVFVALFVGVFAVTHVTVLPIGPLWVLGFSERYALVMLPAVALLAARAADPAAPGERGWRPALAGCAALVVIALAIRAVHGERILLLIVAVPALAVLLSALRWRALAPLPLVALAIGGPSLAGPWLDDARFRSRADELDALAALLRPHASRLTGPVYTSSPLLHRYLERTGSLPELDVRFLMRPDHWYEMDLLATTRHGQRETVHAILPDATSGRVADPRTLAPETLPGDASFLLISDPRNELMLPPELWDGALTPLAVGEGDDPPQLLVPTR